jgi:hypothetical protein
MAGSKLLRLRWPHVLDVVSLFCLHPAGLFVISGCGGASNGPGGLVAWASGGRLYRFFEVELHTQVRPARLPLLHSSLSDSLAAMST